MKEDIGVAVITTCFNSEKTIERTIRSVLEQTYQGYRYYLVDGGSTDGTMEIVKKYASEYSEKISFISEKDRGIYDGINKGIRMALENRDNAIIGIVNSDDFYEKDTLETVVAAYSDRVKEQSHLILYGAIRVLQDGKEKSIWLNHHEFLSETMIAHPACFISTSVYRDYGLYSMEYKSAADYEFMLRMSQNDKVKFFPVYKVLSNFSTGGFSDSKLGDHETKYLKYQYGYLSKKRYLFHLLSYYLKFWRK